MDGRLEEDDWRASVGGLLVAVGGFAVGLEWYYAITLGTAVAGVIELAVRGLPGLGYESGGELLGDNWVSFVSGGLSTVAAVVLLGTELWIALCIGIVASILLGSLAGDVPATIESDEGRESGEAAGEPDDAVAEARKSYVEGEVDERQFERDLETALDDEMDTGTDGSIVTERDATEQN